MRRTAKAPVVFVCLIAMACGQRPSTSEAPAPDSPTSSPQRIISLAPNITEMLYALGLDERIVGTTTFCDYPEKAKSTEKVGGYMDPNLEMLVALKPDLIISYKGSTKAIEFTGKRNIATLAFTVETIQDATEALLAIGSRTETGERARELTQEISADLHALESVLADQPVRKALFVVGRDTGSLKNLYAAGPGTYLDDIFHLIRVENALRESRNLYPIVDKELLISANPEVILERIQGDQHTPQREAGQRSQWSALASVDAVRNGRIVFHMDDRITINGPDIAHSAVKIAALIHGLDQDQLEEKVRQYRNPEKAGQP